MKRIIYLFIIFFIFQGILYPQSSGWNFQNPKNTNMTLNSVRFLTQNDVLATGYYGTLLKSTDAGLTWSNPITTTSIRGFESLVFWNTSFINAATGFMTGNNSGSSTKIYKTTNSGQYWSPVSAFNGSGESIQFLNESTGWATSSLFIFRTTNGGSSWDSNFIPMPSMVRSIYFIDAITGYSCLYRRVTRLQIVVRIG